MAGECEFDLVPVDGGLAFDDGTWHMAKMLLLEMQPARSVTLVGEPPTRVRVLAHGTLPEVAPAILSMLSELAGVELRMEPSPKVPLPARPEEMRR